MTETRVMTLSDFLLARIAEDEAAARALAEAMRDDAWNIAWAVEETLDEESDYGARFNPSRVLAECKAKREIVSIVRRLGGHYEPDAAREAPGILRHLASVYADHPDYREEWKV